MMEDYFKPIVAEKSMRSVTPQIFTRPSEMTQAMTDTSRTFLEVGGGEPMKSYDTLNSSDVNAITTAYGG